MEVNTRVPKVVQVAIVNELNIMNKVFARPKYIRFFSVPHFTKYCYGVLLDLYIFYILSQNYSEFFHSLNIVIVLHSL